MPESYMDQVERDMGLRDDDRYMQIVAWRVKDFADGWILVHTEEHARRAAHDMGGALIEPLYRLMHKSELK